MKVIMGDINQQQTLYYIEMEKKIDGPQGLRIFITTTIARIHTTGARVAL